MSEAELIFTALSELSTSQIAETKISEGFKENKISVKKEERLPRMREKLPNRKKEERLPRMREKLSNRKPAKA